MELNVALENAVGALNALAHASRLSIFRTLVQAGPEGVRVGDLGSALGIPGATLNHHIKQLKTSGLVNATRSGREISLRANYQAMNRLLIYLSENCCQGSGAAGCGGVHTPSGGTQPATDARTGQPSKSRSNPR